MHFWCNFRKKPPRVLAVMKPLLSLFYFCHQIKRNHKSIFVNLHFFQFLWKVSFALFMFYFTTKANFNQLLRKKKIILYIYILYFECTATCQILLFNNFSAFFFSFCVLVFVCLCFASGLNNIIYTSTYTLFNKNINFFMFFFFFWNNTISIIFVFSTRPFRVYLHTFIPYLNGWCFKQNMYYMCNKRKKKNRAIFFLCCLFCSFLFTTRGLYLHEERKRVRGNIRSCLVVLLQL